MREIKFRAWHKSTKTMFFVKIITMTSKGVFACFLTDEISSRDVNPGEICLMQFTGLCDKNKREIYEGDILQDTYIVNNQEHKSWVMQVLWIPRDCCFGLKPSTPYDYSPLNYNKHREIIGNVFQNKDLLKKKP